MRNGFPGRKSPFARSAQPCGTGSPIAGKGFSASTPRTSRRSSGLTSGDTMRRMERPAFIKFCAASAAAAGSPAVAADARPRFYQRVKLVDEDGAALRAGSVPANRNLIFHYPYASTPCFLLNLGRPAKASAHLKTADERSYEWTGGVGARHSLVAYSELCALGTLGGELFNEFFAKYEFRLATEHGAQAHAAVTGPCVVQELEHYCRQQVKC